MCLVLARYEKAEIRKICAQRVYVEVEDVANVLLFANELQGILQGNFPAIEVKGSAILASYIPCASLQVSYQGVPDCWVIWLVSAFYRSEERSWPSRAPVIAYLETAIHDAHYGNHLIACSSIVITVDSLSDPGLMKEGQARFDGTGCISMFPTVPSLEHGTEICLSRQITQSLSEL